MLFNSEDVNEASYVLLIQRILTFFRRMHHVPLMWHPTKTTRNLNAPYAHAEA